MAMIEMQAWHTTEAGTLHAAGPCSVRTICFSTLKNIGNLRRMHAFLVTPPHPNA
jgi:hypothetical protein